MKRSAQVKICGLTRLEDAKVAAEAGADFLGFILYPPSKRGTTAENVAEIVKSLRTLPNCPVLVGVFVNEPPETVLETINQCGLDLAQLHGEEVPSQINDPNAILHGRAFKVLRPQSLIEAEADAEWYIAECPGLWPTILIDAYHPELYGGTGELSDWEVGKAITHMTNGLMLAGGLTVDNVAKAVAEVQPFAVDVASGVEASPGIKDHELVRAFIRNAKSVKMG
ncbi:MAG: phosphoribosylanthranilate isomerase [Cellvibrionaceae bacterium]|jgi:phosphoribosylanthranilate isomerase